MAILGGAFHDSARQTVPIILNGKGWLQTTRRWHIKYLVPANE